MIDATEFDGVSGVALLGFGRIAEVLYGPSLASAPAILVCEQNEQRHSAILDALPAAVIVGSVTELTAPKDCKGVAFNLLPGPDHALYSRRLLEQGWNVFTEKPAANSTKEWRDLVAIARTRRRVIVAAPITPYLDQVQLLRLPNALEKIGKLVEVHGVYFGGGPARRGYVDHSRQWFFGHHSCVVRDLAPYVLAAMISLLGAPNSITWYRSNVRTPIEVRPSGSIVPPFGPSATAVGMWGDVLGSVSVAYHTMLQNVEAKLVLSGTAGQLQIDLEENFLETQRPETKVQLAISLVKRAMQDANYWSEHTTMVESTLSSIFLAPGLDEEKAASNGTL